MVVGFTQNPVGTKKTTSFWYQLRPSVTLGGLRVNSV